MFSLEWDHFCFTPILFPPPAIQEPSCRPKRGLPKCTLHGLVGDRLQESTPTRRLHPGQPAGCTDALLPVEGIIISSDRVHSREGPLPRHTGVVKARGSEYTWKASSRGAYKHGNRSSSMSVRSRDGIHATKWQC